MRRYNSLNSSKEGIDSVDSIDVDEPRESTPFTIEFEDKKKYTKTLCLVFTLFFGGLVVS
jgi:hypothetical protein